RAPGDRIGPDRDSASAGGDRAGGIKVAKAVGYCRGGIYAEVVARRASAAGALDQKIAGAGGGQRPSRVDVHAQVSLRGAQGAVSALADHLDVSAARTDGGRGAAAADAKVN